VKTLFITSIYSKLWGTEFGGRPSRNHHYRLSLLNILNTQPSKVVCFTSPEELSDLENFFFSKHNVDRNILELRSFDLKDSKYFTKIKSKKDLEEMKKLDRCYEIQYNKFFWFDLIDDRFSYDRVYWIDAGLSHGGLFPGQYRIDGPDRYYNINLFNPDTLSKINSETENNILLLSKNNSGKFFWSQTLPKNYYNEYNFSRHIIGGMFGSTPENYNLLKDLFDDLLKLVLEQEEDLYMEELFLSCIYFNNKSLFITKEFDDWFKRENHEEGKFKYFYHTLL